MFKYTVGLLFALTGDSTIDLKYYYILLIIVLLDIIILQLSFFCEI